MVIITKITQIPVLPGDESVLITDTTGNPTLTASGTVTNSPTTVTCSLTLKPETARPQVINVQVTVGYNWFVPFGEKPAGTYRLECTAPNEPGAGIDIVVE